MSYRPRQLTTAFGMRKRGSRGFSLVSAIFLLVVLAGLGAAIVNVSTSQHVSSALDVQGSRAYLAARAGLEWGLYQQLQVPGAACGTAAAPVATTFALPNGSTLAAFTVTVTCIKTPGAVTALDQTQLTAVACNQPTGGICSVNVGGGTTFVQRVVQVKF